MHLCFMCTASQMYISKKNYMHILRQTVLVQLFLLLYCILADSSQSKKFFAFCGKKILCKKNDAKKAKKNITLKLPFWGHFGSKIPIFRKFYIEIYFFTKYEFQ